MFYGCNLEQCILHVLPGCKNLYESAEGWKDFANIVEDADPTSIATPFADDAVETPVFSIYGNRVSDATAKGLQIRNGQVVLKR